MEGLRSGAVIWYGYKASVKFDLQFKAESASMVTYSIEGILLHTAPRTTMQTYTTINKKKMFIIIILTPNKSYNMTITTEANCALELQDKLI